MLHLRTDPSKFHRQPHWPIIFIFLLFRAFLREFFSQCHEKRTKHSSYPQSLSSAERADRRGIGSRSGRWWKTCPSRQTRERFLQPARQSAVRPAVQPDSKSAVKGEASCEGRNEDTLEVEKMASLIAALGPKWKFGYYRPTQEESA